jgi:ABC-type nitrate/sulfonate/bicarbonate transport system permease component
MAASSAVTARRSRPSGNPVWLVRIGIVVALLILWQITALSGLLYRDVVPPLQAIGSALVKLLTSGAFYANLRTTAYETLVALAVGGGTGLAAGFILGGSRFLGRAFEPYLYYLGPTPKIIFFPIMIMWFGVGPGSKMAMGALSCFFPVALSTAVGMRGIAPIYVRVGRTFQASLAQMIWKIYLPAMREPVINGLRLGLGIALIGVLLAETKLSNQGLGFLVIQNYQRFDMPAMYALLIVVFALATIANALMSRLAGGAPHQPGK